MKLRDLYENTQDTLSKLNDILTIKYGHNQLLDKIIKFSRNKKEFTDPGERHTSSIAQDELRSGKRLAARIWAEDLTDEIVLPHKIDGRYIYIAISEEMLEFLNFDGSETHIVRGLVFGYEPKGILEFYERNKKADNAKDTLRDMGIKLSMDINGGYASGYNHGHYSAIVEPNDYREALDIISNKYKIIKINRWCPECWEQKEADEGVCPDCGDVIEDRRELACNKRPWYNIQFI